MNLNREDPVKSSPGPSEASALSPVDARDKMKADWAAGIRRIESFRENMAIARIRRREDALKLPGLQLLRAYPALGLPELVSRPYHTYVQCIFCFATPYRNFLSNYVRFTFYIESAQVLFLNLLTGPGRVCF